jgi:predicted AAA+ superfamily ATPase
MIIAFIRGVAKIAQNSRMVPFASLQAPLLLSNLLLSQQVYYLRTKDDVEVDLVVDRPGKPLLFVEIKSSKQISEEDISSLTRISKDFDSCETVCFSRDKYKKVFGNITVYPWKEGLRKFFSG